MGGGYVLELYILLLDQLNRRPYYQISQTSVII